MLYMYKLFLILYEFLFLGVERLIFIRLGVDRYTLCEEKENSFVIQFILQIILRQIQVLEHSTLS